MNKQNLAIIVLLAIGFAGGWAILDSGPPETHDDHGHEAEHEHAGEVANEAERGPNGGRLLQDGAFSLELKIVEDEHSPGLRLFAYENGKPVTPDGITASVELIRLGGRVERIGFVPQNSYLQAKEPVEEPHSFDISVQATFEGQRHSWSYPAYEDRVEISPEAALAAGVRVARAGPALIRESLLLYGSIIADDRRVRTVAARFPGVVQEVRKNLGDGVSTDAILATVESNESLQIYPVRSPIAGVVVSRNVNPGENVTDQPLFTVADLSTVWAELAVFRKDLGKIRLGQPVRVRSDDGGIEAEGKVTFISPLGSGESQSVKLRVSLDNRDGRWQPGIFVVGEVEVAAVEVPVAVAVSGLQTYRESDVVFANEGKFYEPRLLDIGRRGRDFAEVRSGIQAGDQYVVANSFLLKADIGKSSAGHDH